MTVELRLCDEDWETFGGPEWLVFDQDALDDLPGDILDRFEREMDMSIWVLRHVEMTARTTRAVKATCWLARQMSGLDTPGFKAFVIKPLKVTARSAGDDSVPPESASPPSEVGEDQAEIQDSSNPSTDDTQSETP